MNNFWQRLLTGIGFVGIISAAVVWSPLTSISLFLLVQIFTLSEFYSLFNLPRLYKYSGLMCGTLLYLVISLYAAGLIPAFLIIFLIPALFILLIPAVFNHGSEVFGNTGTLLLGLLYIPLPLGLFIYTAFPSNDYSYNFQYMLAVLVLTWVNDTMAYVSGNLFGKHKFYEKLSPKKTWEGVIGGFVFTLLFSFVFFHFFNEIAWIHWLFISIIVSVFAILGDLFESRIKRGLGIKDSGSFFPGHGGFLDRFDALLFVIPFIFFYIFVLIY